MREAHEFVVNSDRDLRVSGICAACKTQHDTKDQPRVIHCSTCDNSQELNDQITDQMVIDDGWVLEPVVYCPRCGPDD